MINYIKGTLVSITENSIIVENGGIGYEIFVPLSVMDRIGQTGSGIKIYTYMYVREDLIQLLVLWTRTGLRYLNFLLQ